HLLGKELARVARLPVRHVAVVKEAEEMADPQALDAFLELLPDGVRAAGDDEALVHELLPRQVREDPLRLDPELGEGAVLDRVDRPVARRIGKRWEDVQTPVEEVETVLGVELLRLTVRVRDA